VILSSCKVQFPLANTYSPLKLNSSKNELILIILNHGAIGIIRNDLDGTHPLSILKGGVQHVCLSR